MGAAAGPIARDRSHLSANEEERRSLGGGKTPVGGTLRMKLPMAGGEEIRGGAEAFEARDTYGSIRTGAAAVVTVTGRLLCGG